MYTNFKRESSRRTAGFNTTEPIERRRNNQPLQQHSPSQQIQPREIERIQLERENNLRLNKEREEENLNEISFGTRRGGETENENIFGDSDTTSQGKLLTLLILIFL